MKKFSPILFIAIIYTVLISFLLYPFLYEFLKPFGKQIFGSKDALWTAFGTIPAIATFFIGSQIKEYENKKMLINSLKLLKNEIINNINSVFTTEIGRPICSDAFENLKKNFYYKVKDTYEFEKLQKLYNDLKYYQPSINKNSLEVIFDNNHFKKPFLSCNSFIKYFEDSDYLNFKDDPKPSYKIMWELAIKRKEENIEKWIKNLNINIKKIF